MALNVPPLTSLSRRGFLFGCAAATFVGSRISEVVFASDAAAADQGDVVVTVFLRGGWTAEHEDATAMTVVGTATGVFGQPSTEFTDHDPGHAIGIRRRA